MTTYRIVNGFHGFEKETKSQNPATIRRIVRDSKPSDCKSRTTVYAVENGVVVGEAHLVDGELRIERM